VLFQTITFADTCVQKCL